MNKFIILITFLCLAILGLAITNITGPQFRKTIVEEKGLGVEIYLYMNKTSGADQRAVKKTPSSGIRSQIAYVKKEFDAIGCSDEYYHYFFPLVVGIVSIVVAVVLGILCILMCFCCRRRRLIPKGILFVLSVVMLITTMFPVAMSIQIYQTQQCTQVQGSVWTEFNLRYEGAFGATAPYTQRPSQYYVPPTREGYTYPPLGGGQLSTISVAPLLTPTPTGGAAAPATPVTVVDMSDPNLYVNQQGVAAYNLTEGNLPSYRDQGYSLAYGLYCGIVSFVLTVIVVVLTFIYACRYGFGFVACCNSLCGGCCCGANNSNAARRRRRRAGNRDGPRWGGGARRKSGSGDPYVDVDYSSYEDDNDNYDDYAEGDDNNCDTCRGGDSHYGADDEGTRSAKRRGCEPSHKREEDIYRVDSFGSTVRSLDSTAASFHVPSTCNLSVLSAASTSPDGCDDQQHHQQLSPLPMLGGRGGGEHGGGGDAFSAPASSTSLRCASCAQFSAISSSQRSMRRSTDPLRCDDGDRSKSVGRREGRERVRTSSHSVPYGSSSGAPPSTASITLFRRFLLLFSCCFPFLERMVVEEAMAKETEQSQRVEWQRRRRHRRDEDRRRPRGNGGREGGAEAPMEMGSSRIAAVVGANVISNGVVGSGVRSGGSHQIICNSQHQQNATNISMASGDVGGAGDDDGDGVSRSVSAAAAAIGRRRRGNSCAVVVVDTRSGIREWPLPSSAAVVVDGVAAAVAAAAAAAAGYSTEKEIPTATIISSSHAAAGGREGAAAGGDADDVDSVWSHVLADPPPPPQSAASRNARTFVGHGDTRAVDDSHGGGGDDYAYTYQHTPASQRTGVAVGGRGDASAAGGSVAVAVDGNEGNRRQHQHNRYHDANANADYIASSSTLPVDQPFPSSFPLTPSAYSVASSVGIRLAASAEGRGRGGGGGRGGIVGRSSSSANRLLPPRQDHLFYHSGTAGRSQQSQHQQQRGLGCGSGAAARHNQRDHAVVVVPSSSLLYPSPL